MTKFARAPVLVLALALALSLIGCAGAPSSEAPARSPLLQLALPPASLGQQLLLSQIVTGESQGRTHSLRMEVEATAEHLVMAGFSHLGVPLFTLRQDADGLDLDAPGIDRFPFDPRHMLVDVKLAYWPAAALDKALRLLDMRLAVDADRRERRIFGPDGVLLVAIAFPPRNLTDGEISLQHYDHPYRLRIKTLNMERSP